MFSSDDIFAVCHNKRYEIHWWFTGLSWKYIKDSSCESTSEKLTPSLSNMVAVYRSPWQIHPTQTGTILKPSDSEMCRIHQEYKDLPAVDNLCAQLPFALVGNRMWNLPETQGYLFHSGRVPDIGEGNRAIEGVDAFWETCGSHPVPDDSGMQIGMSRHYKLVFGELSEDGEVSCCRGYGMWRAQEFTCLDKMDGDSSIVALYCKNERLNSLQVQIGLTEYDMSSRLQKNLQLNEKKQAGIDNLKDLEGSYLDILGTCFAQIHLERVLCSEREQRMARGVLNVEGGLGYASDDVGTLYVDGLPESHRNKSKFLAGTVGRRMQGGVRVRERKRKRLGKHK